nr:ABC transporter substrate-binding protein [Maliibacterium massiliense]
MKIKRLLVCVLCLALVCAGSLSMVGCSKKPTVHVYNWEDYIDPAVVEMFEEEYGVKVKYSAFTTNEDMFALMQSGATSYDVIFPSDYMIERMVANDMLQPIDYNRVDQFENIEERWQKGLDFDPEGKYSVPYMWGTVGILYNKTMVNGEIDSWDALWDPQYSGNILMIDSIRDALGISLKREGFSLNTKDTAELEQAKQALIDQKPLVLAYVVDQAKDKMIRGEAAMALVWSGDAKYAMEQNEDLDYVVPKEGSNVWVDSMVVPANAKNAQGAMDFINFMCRPDIAQMNAEYIGYCSPNKAALENMDAEITEDERFYITDEEYNKCEYFHDLGDALETYNEMWSEIKSGGN